MSGKYLLGKKKEKEKKSDIQTIFTVYFSSTVFFPYKSLCECFTILSACTMYRHLEYNCTHPSKYKSKYSITCIQRPLTRSNGSCILHQMCN